MNEIVFGSPEHLAGLSRAALEADFRFVNDRRNELEDACEQLEAENTRLRSCLEDAAENERLTTYEFNQLKEERDKLRELLGVMAYCNQFRRDCDGCSMNGAAGIITERAGCDELLDRLRELGVEVEQ